MARQWTLRTTTARACAPLTLDDVEQRDYVGPAPEILQNLDLPLDLFLLDRLEDLDDAARLVLDVDALEHLAILSPAHFPNDLVGVLIAPVHGAVLVVPAVA